MRSNHAYYLERKGAAKMNRLEYIDYMSQGLIKHAIKEATNPEKQIIIKLATPWHETLKHIFTNVVLPAIGLTAVIYLVIL
jgi:hypothetical protein